MRQDKAKKRKSGRYASVFFDDQIAALDKIAAEKGVSRADLLRSIVDAYLEGIKDAH